MDILIKGMKMPVDHGIFIVICPDGTIEQKVGNADNGYPIYNIVKDAKAVALPSHGDLVDITPIRDKMSRIMNRYDIDDWGGKLADLIENAETIVEATE